MDDMMNKIQGMLSDEESLKQIKELADMFMSASEEDDTNEENISSEYAEGETDNSSNSNSDDGLGIDLGMMMKLLSMFSSAPKNDKNTQLLLALKPLLKEEKQDKIDKIVKVMKLLAIFTIVKESGMLNDMF